MYTVRHFGDRVPIYTILEFSEHLPAQRANGSGKLTSLKVHLTTRTNTVSVERPKSLA